MNFKKICIAIVVFIVLLIGGIFLYKMIKKADPVKLDTPVVELSDDLVTWQKIDNSIKYELSINGNLSYVEATITEMKLNDGDSFKVRAIGDEINYLTSEWSNTVIYNKQNIDDNKYTVTWVINGVTSEIDNNVNHGLMPSYDGETPVKEGNEYHYYEFIGWSPEVTNVTSDITYEAVFKEIKREYKVSFYSNDGLQLLSESIVKAGEKAIYSGDTPSKVTNDLCTYEFEKWVYDIATNAPANLDNITSDIKVYASFKNTSKLVSVYIIVNNDNYGKVSINKLENIYKGSLIEVVEDNIIINGNIITTIPTDSTEQYNYVFDSWTTTTYVEDSTIIKANFAQILRTYTVTWMSENIVLEIDSNVPYGTYPTFNGETPVHSGNVDDYEFIGWNPEISNVTKDVVYDAIFKDVSNKHLVRFFDEDGVTLLGLQYVDKGSSAEYPNELPSKLGNEKYEYSFNKWVTTCGGDEEAILTNITDNIDVYASYNEILKKYTVKFIDVEGIVYSEELVEYGSNATPPVNPYKPGYRFDKWDNEGINIIEDTVIIGSFIKIYEVHFLDYNNSIIAIEVVDEGKDVVLPDASTRANYKFINWDNDCKNITSDIIVRPIYVRIYKVTVLDDFGAIYETLYIEEGKSASPSHSDKIGYHFIGWSENIDNITSDIVISPIYEINSYNVIFKSKDGKILQYDASGNLIDNSNIKHSMPVTTPLVDKYWLNSNSGICYEFSGWYYNNNGEEILFDTNRMTYNEIVTTNKPTEIEVVAKYTKVVEETLLYVDNKVDEVNGKVISKLYLITDITNFNGINIELSYNKSLFINDSSSITIPTVIKNNVESTISEYYNTSCEYVFGITSEKGININGSLCLFTIEFLITDNLTNDYNFITMINDNCFIINNNYNKIKPKLIYSGITIE